MKMQTHHHDADLPRDRHHPLANPWYSLVAYHWSTACLPLDLFVSAPLFPRHCASRRSSQSYPSFSPPIRPQLPPPPTTKSTGPKNANSGRFNPPSLTP